jgi:hypothetical protein
MVMRADGSACCSLHWLPRSIGFHFGAFQLNTALNCVVVSVGSAGMLRTGTQVLQKAQQW